MGSSKYRTWGQDELAALRRGVHKHGAGNWEAIRNDPEFAETLATRSGEQIKDKWRNLIKFNHVSAEEAAACSRNNRRRGAKRSQTFDTATTLRQRMETNTLQGGSTGASISEDMQLLENSRPNTGEQTSPDVSSSGPGNIAWRSGNRRPVKSRSTVSDFRNLMNPDHGLQRDPLSLDSARLELTGMGPSITTGANGFSLQNFELDLMQSGLLENSAKQVTFASGNGSQGSELLRPGGSRQQIVLPNILSDFGLGHNTAGYGRGNGIPPPGSGGRGYASSGPFPMGLGGQQDFGLGQFSGNHQNYRSSDTSVWGSGYSNNQNTGPSRMSFDNIQPPGSFNGLVGDDKFSQPQRQQENHAQQQQQNGGSGNFGQTAGNANWDSTFQTSNPFAAHASQPFPPPSMGMAEFPPMGSNNGLVLDGMGSMSFGKLDFEPFSPAALHTTVDTKMAGQSTFRME